MRGGDEDWVAERVAHRLDRDCDGAWGASIGPDYVVFARSGVELCRDRHPIGAIRKAYILHGKAFPERRPA